MLSRKLARSVAARTAAAALAISASVIVNTSSVTGVVSAQAPARSAQTSEWRVRFRRTGVLERERHNGSGRRQGKDRRARQVPGRHGQSCTEAERRFIRRPHDQDRWPHHVFVNSNFEVTGAIG